MMFMFCWLMFMFSDTNKAIVFYQIRDIVVMLFSNFLIIYSDSLINFCSVYRLPSVVLKIIISYLLIFILILFQITLSWSWKQLQPPSLKRSLS